MPDMINDQPEIVFKSISLRGSFRSEHSYGYIATKTKVHILSSEAYSFKIVISGPLWLLLE